MSRFRLATIRLSSIRRALPWMALASLVLAGCGGKGGQAEGGAAGGFPPAEVTVVTVAPADVAVPYEFTGTIEGSREVEVRARVSGILLRRYYEEGRPVTKGQLLFQIDPAEYKARVAETVAKVAEEKAKLTRAERDVARLEPLLAAHAASRKDYDNAVADREEAAATVQSAQAQVDQAELDLAYTRVEAPISGLSSRAERSEGSLVGPGENSLLTHISQVRPIWVRFSVPDQTLLGLRKSVADRSVRSPSTDQLGVELVLPDGSVHPERGRVNFSDSMIDAATGSVGLRAQLANGAGTLIPGQFVRVRLLGIERPQAIIVPQRAVQQGAEGKFVFVVGADGKAALRPVVAGDWLGKDWVIESGLAAGDKVIVDGVVKVQPGAPVKVVESNPPSPPSQGGGSNQAAPTGGPAGAGS